MGKPTSRQAGENASDAHGIKIGIRRLGSGVQISLHCAGDYQAIELYDRLTLEHGKPRKESGLTPVFQ
jgi:hypothetical protein